MVKNCSSDKILNPKTNRCVLKTGKIGKAILGGGESKKMSKQQAECPSDKILNPKTKRCVSKTGKIGKELLKKSKVKWWTDIEKTINKIQTYISKDTIHEPFTVLFPVESVFLRTFSSDRIDNEWMNSQLNYWLDLSLLNKLYLYSYSFGGDKLLNEYLRNGTKALLISKIQKPPEDVKNMHPLYPVMIEYYDKVPHKFSLDWGKLDYLDFPSYKGFKFFMKRLSRDEVKRNLEFLLKKYMERVKDIIEKSPKLKSPIMVARGSENPLEYSGKWLNAFISTSLSIREAKDFYKQDKGSLDIYILEAGTPCIPMFWTRYVGEKEILLSPKCCSFKTSTTKLTVQEKHEIIKQLSNVQTKTALKLIENVIRIYSVSPKQ